MEGQQLPATEGPQRGKSLQEIILFDICELMSNIELPSCLQEERTIEQPYLWGTEFVYTTLNNMRCITDYHNPKVWQRIDVFFDDPRNQFGIKFISYNKADTYKLLKALELKGVDYRTTHPRWVPATTTVNDLLYVEEKPICAAKRITLEHIDEKEPFYVKEIKR